jgi:TerC family integral membrane protein
MLRAVAVAAALAGASAHATRPRLTPARALGSTALARPLHLQPHTARDRFAGCARSRQTLALRDEATVPAPLEAEVEEADSYRAALVQTGLIALAACAFAGGIWLIRGQELAFQFFAGYVIEESLSVDNLFVFKLIFDFFAVTGAAQRKCLSYGIWAAAVLRLIMISLGVEAVQHFRPVLLVFAAILMVSAGSILKESLSDEEESAPDLANNPVVKLCNSLFATSDAMDGDKFFTLVDGAKVATPLLVALLCIEVSDVVFAVDSVPAVLGVTSDTFVAFTSNMFAIFGLRALFRVLSTLVSEFEYLQVRAARARGRGDFELGRAAPRRAWPTLITAHHRLTYPRPRAPPSALSASARTRQPAVALVLGFVGSKMVAEYFNYDISIGASLAVIVSILAGGIGLSIVAPTEKEGE